MPTPYGSRGGMAFGADELRVLRGALAVALHPAPLPDEDVQACLRLAESVDEAVREAGRLRAFLLADLARYRAALPGSAAGYLELLQDALAAGYDPRPEDLMALRTLRARPVAAALLDRCQRAAENSVRARLAGRSPAAPAPRTRLLALQGAAPRPTRSLPRRSPGRRRGSSPRRPAARRPPGAPAPSARCPSRPRSSRHAESPRPRRSGGPSASYSWAMDYVSALVPPVVMAAFFIGLVVTIVKSQGGDNKAKEDAAVDAAIARAEAVEQQGGTPSGA